MAVKLLLRNIERTGIAVLMLAPVVALLVGSTMVTSGYAQQAGASVALVTPSDSYVAYQRGTASPSSGTLAYRTFLNVQQEANVTSAVPVLDFPAVVTAGNGSQAASVLATNLTEFVAARESRVYGGAASGAGQVDAGAILAKLLGIRAGDNVTVQAFATTTTLRVVGILNSTDESDTALILPLSSSWALWPQDAGKLSYIEFQTSDPTAVSSLSANLAVVSEEGIGQIANSFDSQTNSLLSNWTYVLFALSAAAAVGAASRVVTEVSREYATLRAIGAGLPTARALAFYELLVISATAVVVGVSAGIVGTSVLGTFFKAMDNLPLSPSIDPVRLALVGAASFLLIIGAGSLALAWLPRRISERGEAT